METVMTRKVKIFTYGCQMNVLDSLKMYSALARAGLKPTDSTREADVIVVNTCSVRLKAYEKAMSNLGRLRTLKERKPSLVIVVTGCAAQQEKGRILERMGHVDLVLGTHRLHLLPGLLEEAAGGSGPSWRRLPAIRPIHGRGSRPVAVDRAPPGVRHRHAGL
jgi:tRNA-2-methylthio-N6-dimethylallyladenosine synthase